MLQAIRRFNKNFNKNVLCQRVLLENLRKDILPSVNFLKSSKKELPHGPLKDNGIFYSSFFILILCRITFISHFIIYYILSLFLTSVSFTESLASTAHYNLPRCRFFLADLVVTKATTRLWLCSLAEGDLGTLSDVRWSFSKQ